MSEFTDLPSRMSAAFGPVSQSLVAPQGPVSTRGPRPALLGPELNAPLRPRRACWSWFCSRASRPGSRGRWRCWGQGPWWEWIGCPCLLVGEQARATAFLPVTGQRWPPWTKAWVWPRLSAWAIGGPRIWRQGREEKAERGGGRRRGGTGEARGCALRPSPAPRPLDVRLALSAVSWSSRMPLSPGHVRRPHSRRGHLSLQPVVGVHGGQVRKVRLDTSAGPGSTRTGFLAQTCPGGRRGVAGLGKDVRGGAGGPAGLVTPPHRRGCRATCSTKPAPSRGFPPSPRGCGAAAGCRLGGSLGVGDRAVRGGVWETSPAVLSMGPWADSVAAAGSLPLSRTPTAEAVSSPCRGGRAPCGHLGAPEATASVKAPACRGPGPRWSLTVWREALALLGQRHHETAPRDVPLRGAAAGGWKGRRRGAGG